MPFNRHPTIWLLAIIVTLIVFESTSLDLYFQRFLYFPQTEEWFIDRHNPVLSFIFYDGLKSFLFTGAAALLVTYYLGKRIPSVIPYRRALKVTLLSLLCAPLLVVALKSTTNTACPRALSLFGGELQYVRLFESYPAKESPARRQRCFPAGHASGGFALMSVALLFRRRRYRIGAFVAAATLGWIMGVYKMAIGDHFFSHTLISMELSGLVISALNMRLSSKPSLPPTPHQKESIT